MSSRPKNRGHEEVTCLADAMMLAEHITQYGCSRCDAEWWGRKQGKVQCKRCNGWGSPLPLSQQVGIGWFHCDACNREFAGFARGNVKSKCHLCDRKLLPSCIVPGGEAHGKKNKHQHHCEACHGIPPCPIVEEACLRRSGLL